MTDRNRESDREWESEIVRVRKPLRTATEPALVKTFVTFFVLIQ